MEVVLIPPQCKKILYMFGCVYMYFIITFKLFIFIYVHLLHSFLHYICLSVCKLDEIIYILAVIKESESKTSNWRILNYFSLCFWFLQGTPGTYLPPHAVYGPEGSKSTVGSISLGLPRQQDLNKSGMNPDYHDTILKCATVYRNNWN